MCRFSKLEIETFNKLEGKKPYNLLLILASFIFGRPSKHTIIIDAVLSAYAWYNG